MIIQTRPVDRDDGGTDFIGSCGKSCWSIGKEGSVVDECQHYESKIGWCEAEITCRKGQ